MVTSTRHFVRLGTASIALLASSALAQSRAVPASLDLNSNWQLQDSAKVPDPAASVSSASYQSTGWLAATVPGTVLTSMVNDGIYPEPMYGENNRETVIPESLNKTSYWYRTTFTVPKDYARRQVWVHFDGAKDEDAVLLIVGEGPGTSTPAEVK